MKQVLRSVLLIILTLSTLSGITQKGIVNINKIVKSSAIDKSENEFAKVEFTTTYWIGGRESYFATVTNKQSTWAIFYVYLPYFNDQGVVASLGPNSSMTIDLGWALWEGYQGFIPGLQVIAAVYKHEEGYTGEAFKLTANLQ